MKVLPRAASTILDHDVDTDFNACVNKNFVREANCHSAVIARLSSDRTEFSVIINMLSKNYVNSTINRIFMCHVKITAIQVISTCVELTDIPISIHV